MDSQIKALSRDDLADSNSFGLHWILIGKLGQYGFRTSSPAAAMQTAEEIITRWHILK